MSKYFVDREQVSSHEIFPGVVIRAAACEKMMLSHVEFEPDAVVEKHSHPHEQVGMVLSGRATFYVGDEEQILEAGDCYTIPGGVPHRVVAMAEGATALDIFSPVREEYL